MEALKIKFKAKKIKALCLELEYDESVPPPLRYDPSHHSLKRSNILTSTAVSLLLNLHMIYAIRKNRELLVVAGKRIFQIASFCLVPEHEINVGILAKQTTPEQLNFLRYIDLIISPLILRTESSASDIFRYVNIPDLRQQAWLQPYASTMSSFASLMGVSPAALVTPPANSAKTVKKSSRGGVSVDAT